MTVFKIFAVPSEPETHAQVLHMFTERAFPCNDTVEMTIHVDTEVKRESTPPEH